jgi:hypothetical protein
MKRPTFPEGKRFAFSIVDDTDVATVANVGPIYELLQALGMRTTKTVWPFRWHGEGSSFVSSETLEDPEYLAFVQRLAADGFEIASHGATMESSDRATTEAAMERHRELFGTVPRLYVNHSFNRENVYWGTARIDDPILKRLYARVNGKPAGYYQGHVPGSPWWWGDLCRSHHEYVRNMTFSSLNVLRANPSMPYVDPSRPLVRSWFSSADADDCREFIDLVTPERVDQLEAEGGVCIISTHLGKRYVENGRVHPQVERALRDLARRPGWFVPVSPLLDWLRSQQPKDTAGSLPSGEWRRMQWRWAIDLVRRRLQRSR